jgi:hypothetical protein
MSRHDRGRRSLPAARYPGEHAHDSSFGTAVCAHLLDHFPRLAAE